jgi:hypothetical protein
MEVIKAGFTYGLSNIYGKTVIVLQALKWSQVNGHPVNVYEAKFHKKIIFSLVWF